MLMHPHLSHKLSFVHHHILAILPILLPNALHKFYKTYTLEKKAIIPTTYFSNCVNTQAKNIIYPPNTFVFLNYLPCNFSRTTFLSSFPIFLYHRSCLALFITFRFMCTFILKTTRHHHPHISKKIKQTHNNRI